VRNAHARLKTKNNQQRNLFSLFFHFQNTLRRQVWGPQKLCEGLFSVV
jgi:hypothetical protein